MSQAFPILAMTFDKGKLGNPLELRGMKARYPLE